MADQLTLTADVGSVVPERIEYGVRPVAISDLEPLARLYFDAYDPGVACATLEEAVTDIRASFDGEYGRLLTRASLVAEDDGSLIGGVLTVHRAAWQGFPDCPLVIELFVRRDYRRRGIGRGLIQTAMTALDSAGEERVALRVNEDNLPARDLYESLGFVTWRPDGGS